MKKIIENDEICCLENLLGETITVFCAIYIYTGILKEIGEESILLKDPKIVYQTGPFDNKKWEDAQPLPNDWFIKKSMIESFGILK